jgi:nucleoside-diphosphate-sugar epimerase
VHTSSSAVFGIPEHNPVTEASPCRPLEAYGRAKLRAELLCRDAVAGGLDVTVVRPRTVLGRGDNRYQLVHANDLADACLRAGDRAGPSVYNVGALEFGTMRETLHALVEHAQTGSRVRSLPVSPARLTMHALASLGLAPFAPYHWLLYSESLYFDVTKARTELGWEPKHSNASMVIESYEWFVAHRNESGGTGRSHHQSPVRPGLVRALKALP